MTQEELKKKNKKTLLITLGVVFGMLVLSYASVPLYDLFCRVTGYGGTTQRAEANPNTSVSDRQITVTFNASTARNMPWNFKPDQRSVSVQIGQDALISYSADNPTDRPVAGTAVFNVTPAKMGKYFNKTQCFCFEQHVLSPGEGVHMPVSFFIDPAMLEDPALSDLTTVTLSYTFFRQDSRELERALEEYADQAQAAY